MAALSTAIMKSAPFSQLYWLITEEGVLEMMAKADERKRPREDPKRRAQKKIARSLFFKMSRVY